MLSAIKVEPLYAFPDKPDRQPPTASLIEILSSDDEDAGNCSEDYSDCAESGCESDCKRKKTRSLKDINGGFLAKRIKLEEPVAAIPLEFLAPLPDDDDDEAVPVPLSLPVVVADDGTVAPARPVNRQFWKAGEFGKDVYSDCSESSEGVDRVRVHPRFLHSNATSHKWALGAFAELLDNALDEVCNGATYVLVDVLTNKRDNSKMLLVEDNGGGMTSVKLRQCMSLGYSAKSKIAHTIGQYGNGFKTSTMRLGADVIVFSRCRGSDGKSASQSIGMLSYTFLKSTQKEDIFVPMIDYERGQYWDKVIRSSFDDWSKNLETILQWSPFTSESDLLKQFDFMKNQGTRIIIYNLWEDDEGQLELDFETDPHDIQIRGVNRDERSLDMARMYPNSRHFLTYKHSLRSYASILYLRLPPDFRIILRGKDVQHHNIVNDMMLTQKVTYRPQAERAGNDSGMVAVVTIGFVKDAHYHIDIQGFNVYHKNRLIKPFWRVWNAAGSSGRGVIGVFEANFVEPAHDKQGFERTLALSRLEARLVAMQKRYWSENSHYVGYSDKRSKNKIAVTSKQEDAPPSDKSKSSSRSTQNGNGHTSRMKSSAELDRRSTPVADTTEDRGSYEVPCPCDDVSQREDGLINGDAHNSASVTEGVTKVKDEKLQLATRWDDETELQAVVLLNNNLTSENESLRKKLETAEKKNEELEKEIRILTNMIAEERSQREEEEEKLRKRLMYASKTIDDLLEKVRRGQRSQN
ncbi:hypothetical protein CDL15_Pgr024545 [Punica granatum]|uniref:Morc S5 domain-containing protein n=1 Tax=Punica granatum TaxID=22663 RepID=A0A218XXK5_PUNGR|nr:hypothetical protein CDL15_Pgr024545 [Punica granatum]